MLTRRRAALATLALALIAGLGPLPLTRGRAEAPAVAAEGPALTTSRATRADQPAIDAQKTCPVSGKGLGSMGGPLKVTRGKSSIFLCCQACLRTIRANPDKFLPR